MVFAPNSTPIVKSIRGSNLLSVNWRIKEDLPTAEKLVRILPNRNPV
jgi:hypothetical protein